MPVADTTLHLLGRAQAGDADALDLLMSRYLPRLQRWAHRRLPAWARDLCDTQDLVQESLVRAFHHIGTFESRGAGALHAYLRQVVMNRIRDEIRRTKRRPMVTDLDPEWPDRAASPVELAVGREVMERYERALERLKPGDRDVIIGRVELGLSNQELSELLGKPSANAARVAVDRALLRLAVEMRQTRRR